MRRASSQTLLALTLAAMLAGCERELVAPPSEDDPVDPAAVDGEGTPDSTLTGGFPRGLEPEEEGYPKTEDPCRRLSDTQATANWRTDGDVLFGCPSFADADALAGGRIVEKLGGITLVSITRGRVEAVLARQGRTLAAGRSYDTRTRISCDAVTGEVVQSCMAGVVRGRPGPEGAPATSRLEVQTPSGEVRPFLFQGSTLVGVDTAARPDLATESFDVGRADPETLRVTFGEEVYLVPLVLLAPETPDPAPRNTAVSAAAPNGL